VPVTVYYDRLSDNALEDYRDDPETFRVENYPDCESIQLYGQEHILIEDLATHAAAGFSPKGLVSRVISGYAGVSVHDNHDFPNLIDRKTVTLASKLMNEIRREDLQSACDLGRLKVKYLEVEEWLWEHWGPNVFEERLLPAFEMIRSFFCRAAERNQHVIVGWF
jgi:hypothetical protein